MTKTYFAFVLNPNPSVVRLKATNFDDADIEVKNLESDCIWIFDADDLREFLTSGDKALNNWA